MCVRSQKTCNQPDSRKKMTDGKCTRDKYSITKGPDGIVLRQYLTVLHVFSIDNHNRQQTALQAVCNQGLMD